MKDKFVFRYDKNTKKGMLVTKNGEFEINLQKKSHTVSEDFLVNNEPGSGSQGSGYGLHLI